LGVVHIRLKETLPDKLMLRMQGGSFGAYRSLINYSPELEHADAFISYEHAYTDGPFINPAATDATTSPQLHPEDFRQRSARPQTKLRSHDFYSSGQIPLDLVSTGQLDHFGFIDPNDGGNVKLGTLGVYYRKI